MIKAICPKCKGDVFDVYNTDGGVENGGMVFYCVCLEDECSCQFELDCNIDIKSVTICNY